MQFAISSNWASVGGKMYIKLKVPEEIGDKVLPSTSRKTEKCKSAKNLRKTRRDLTVSAEANKYHCKNSHFRESTIQLSRQKQNIM